MKVSAKRIIRASLFLIIIFSALYLYARAGGAGGASSGGSRGSSGGSGDGELIFYLIYLLIRILISLPFPFNVISIGLILLVAAIVLNKGKKQVEEKSVFNNIPTDKRPSKQGKIPSRFMADNPGFDQTQFLESVKNAFLQIQDAWMNKDLKNVRKFLSDGVYQRFITQFKMMDLLDQTNRLSDITVNYTFIDKVESDSNYDVLHVAISASLKDNFICGLDSSLNSGGYENFVEYWSFIRRKGVQKKGMFDKQSCPNCGASLEEGLGEVCVCPYCGSLLNSGEYDWVLSEITQAVDYAGNKAGFFSSRSLRQQVKRLVLENSDFSVQFVEDKASNGFLQYITALTLKEPAIMRRFVSDNLYESVKGNFDGRQIVYNRIYLNDVSLVGIIEEEDYNRLYVIIKYSFQRVELIDKKIRIVDPVVISDSKVVVMKRKKGVSPAKGSLYSHNCPNCGGKLSDTLDIHCPYCSVVLNSSDIEWTVDDIMHLDKYRDFLDNNSSLFEYSVSIKTIDSMYDVRDYALNNVLVVAAADGRLDESEKQFVDNLVKKWKYNPEKIKGLYDLAFSGNLTIMMPDNTKKRQKIFELMCKAAAVDGDIDPQEQKILDEVRSYYLS